MKNISFLLLSVFFFSLTSLGQDSNDSSTKDNKSRNHNKVTRIFTFAAMSDIHDENNFDIVLNSPQLGFDFSYNRQEKGKMFSRGLSLGWQPIATTNESIVFDSLPGTLKATNQMFHAHYTLRLAFFRNSGFQPYLEGIVGAKGAALTSSFNSDSNSQEDINDLPYFSATWNYGYAAGIRLRATDFIYVDIRYARVQSGDLKRITNMSIDNTGDINYDTDLWKAPLGYLRAGLTFSF
ncbi:MAG: hypothetical protein COA49_08040 [Bacteroidetes bacterium]|nr:MAG: hypothetical protein COA49_08040 [Bacteroidota bacterium]